MLLTMQRSGSSESLLKNVLWKEILLLKISGLSLTGNEGTLYKIYSFVILFVNYTYPFVQLAGCLLKPDEVDTDTIYCNCGIYLIIAKITVFVRRRAKIREILVRLGKKPFTVNLERGGKVEEKLFKECNLITTVQTWVYFTSLLFIIIGVAVYTSGTRVLGSSYQDWKLPFGKMLIFNLRTSPNFEIVWLYQMLTVSILCSSLTAIDLITFFVLCRLCYQFRYLQNHLKRIMKISFKNMAKDKKLTIIKSTENHKTKISWKYLHKSLRETVCYHLAVIDIASEMENVFSLLFLAILFYTTIILCFMVYRLSVLPISDPEAMTYIIEIIFYSLQVAILSFWGEQVTHESLEVANAAYEVDYTGSDLRFQKGLLLIIERSQTPIKITAAKFADIRLATFVWIIRATYSSFMLLRHLQTNNNV